MKILHVPYVDGLNELPMTVVSALLPNVGAQLQIDQQNWPIEYPEKPETEVFVAHGMDYLYILYCVNGKQLRALALEDQQEVWKDSCVEFFCRVPGNRHYVHFETNCIGTMVAAERLGQNVGVKMFTSEQMKRIRRYSSLEHQKIEEMDGMFSWRVALAIPMMLMMPQKPEFPLTMEANFYKCADDSKYPHFISWNPIDLPHPSFHCPEFFGFMVLEA